jgi:AcrR family transcriptional regulator
MARPTQADAQSTQKRILQAASALFADRGVDATSVRDVAKEAGITLATVHHYFGTKEQLYGACIDAMYVELESLRESLEPELIKGGSPVMLLEAGVRASFRFAIGHRGAIRLLLRTIIDTGRLEPVRRQNVHLPFLERSGVALAFLFGRDQNDMRLAVQSVMHLIVRYAVTAPEELMHLTHAKDEASALTAIEDHLVRLASEIVGAQR